MGRTQRHLKKIIVGLLGGVVFLVGIVLIPYPGPGWLIVFFGLTILATEFMWAQGVLDSLRKKYDRWQIWMRGQSRIVQIMFLVLTAIVVIITIWLFNGYGLINSWFGLNQDWLVSPFVQIDPTP